MSDITRGGLSEIGCLIRNSGNEFTAYANKFYTFSNGLFVVKVALWCDCDDEDIRTYSGVVGRSPSRLPHIRTLPQLRRLIRSLFGDDALPRRELLSITDEECFELFEIVFDGFVDYDLEVTYRDTHSIHIEFKEEGYMVGVLVLSGLIFTHSPCDSQGNTVDAYKYLEEDCDLFLPGVYEE